MAVIKIKTIKSNLQAVINYGKNGEKTEHGILVSGINCNVATSYEEMALTKKFFHKEGKTLGYHIIQSFKGYEVPPEKANQIGKELAEELWGDKYQVVICTHINKQNVHNHIIINSVSFVDGNKYHNSNVEIAFLKETNDEICMKYGLSILNTYKANKEKEIAQKRIANYNRSSGKMELIKSDIDEAISKSGKYQDFINILNSQGYYIKKGGSSISTPYYNRNIRLARAFGDEYSVENIKARIYHYTTEIKQEKKYKVRIYDGVKIDSELLKKSHFYRLYVHYLYLFGKLPAKVHYEERSAEYYKAIDKMEKTSDEIRFIGKYEIQNINDVTKIKNELTENMNNLKENKKQLLKKYTKAEDIDKEKIKTKIENITFGISKISKEIQTCRKIINNTERGEKEQKLIEQREKENLNINHKNIKKEKSRIK
jgi:hypothetical protein